MNTVRGGAAKGRRPSTRMIAQRHCAEIGPIGSESAQRMDNRLSLLLATQPPSGEGLGRPPHPLWPGWLVIPIPTHSEVQRSAVDTGDVRRDRASTSPRSRGGRALKPILSLGPTRSVDCSRMRVTKDGGRPTPRGSNEPLDVRRHRLPPASRNWTEILGKFSGATRSTFNYSSTPSGMAHDSDISRRLSGGTSPSSSCSPNGQNPPSRFDSERYASASQIGSVLLFANT